jgi:hypothetical protein
MDTCKKNIKREKEEYVCDLVSPYALFHPLWTHKPGIGVGARGGSLNGSVKTKFTIYVDGFKTLYQIVSCWDTGQRRMPLYLKMCVLGKYRNDIFACEMLA